MSVFQDSLVFLSPFHTGSCLTEEKENTKNKTVLFLKKKTNQTFLMNEFPISLSQEYLLQ